MGKPAPPPAPEPFMLDPLKDAFLFSGDYGWVFYAALIGFCAANAMTILKANRSINYFHGCALMVLANFGGSTMAAIMCGQPVAFVTNEALVTVCLAVWTAFYLLPDLLSSLFQGNVVGKQLTSMTYEIMRCHVLMNCTKMAAGVLPAKLAGAGRVAIIGPLIAGTLGGCGGGFMPLNKGLEPLAAGLNWRIASAALNSLWLFLSMQYPATKAAIGIDGDWARAVAVAFFVLVPVVEGLTGMAFLGANPTRPAAEAPKPSGKAKKA